MGEKDRCYVRQNRGSPDWTASDGVGSCLLGIKAELLRNLVLVRERWLAHWMSRLF